MKKINIATARKLFNKGEKIYVLPNKVALGNPWVSPSSIEKINDETFDYIISDMKQNVKHFQNLRA